MTIHNWHDDEVSLSVTDPDEILRQERIALANYTARMLKSRARTQAKGASSMRELMKRKKTRDGSKNLLSKSYALGKRSK